MSADTLSTNNPTIESLDLDSCPIVNVPNGIEATSCKVNHYIILHGFPCRVTSVKISKTGKHGTTKAVIT
jgi:hypothetical protein